MAEFVGRYRSQIPAHRWAQIESLVCAAVSDMNFERIHDAKNYLAVTARFVDWATRIGGTPLDRDKIFRPEVIDNYIVIGCDGFARSTCATYRSRLLQMSDRFHPQPYRLPYGIAIGRFENASVPYTLNEVEQLRLWARWQRSDYRRVNATALLSLGLGVGLTAGEIIATRAEDIDVDREGAQVNVRGRRPRIVPLRAEWEELVVSIAKSAMRRDMFLISPRRRVENSPTLITNFLRRATPAPTHLNAHRMRATWIVGHMANRVPPAVIAKAAGLESPDGLLRFASFVPEADTETVRAWLRDASVPPGEEVS